MENNETPGVALLQKSDTFIGKIKDIVEYLEIKGIWCSTHSPVKKPVTDPQKKYKVLSIYVKNGTPSYIARFLNTAMPYLEMAIENTIEAQGSYHGIRDELNHAKKLCFGEIEKYNYSSPHFFTAIHAYRVGKDQMFFPCTFENLDLSSDQIQELRDHCDVRRRFLEKLHTLIDHKLNGLVNLPDLKQSPYKWNAAKPEIEITELLYALKLAGRIEIEKGYEVQFREHFFKLFGLTDSIERQKVELDLRRKKKGSLLHQLVTEIENARSASASDRNRRVRSK